MKKYIIILFVLFSCGHKLKKGVITQMYIEPERNYIYMMPIPHTITVGKTSSTYFTYFPMMMHDDADYVTTILMHRSTTSKKQHGAAS